MKAYPTYRDYCKFLYCMQKRRGERRFIPKGEKIVRYGLALIVITVAWIVFGIILLMLHSAAKNSQTTKYPSSKYRKVVKEGLLWNTYEYHER